MLFEVRTLINQADHARETAALIKDQSVADVLRDLADQLELLAEDAQQSVLVPTACSN
jgi:hypothetical protein